MKPLTKTSGLAIALLLVLGCGDTHTDDDAVALDPATTREISQGMVTGTRGRDNAMAWYGIPYAAPPVGDLRWRAPRPPAGWPNEFPALDIGHRCTQFTSRLEPDVEEGQIAGSEDCLYLNVWAPSVPADEPLPVMFWIHGGSNVWGWSGQYELGRLAERENLVVVSANYRLGPFGWLAHEALRESATVPLDRTANFALLDLTAALDWVSGNIAAFGGDPGNVTVFGESAGGFNAGALLASPLASGKFHKAIIQSGGFSFSTLQEAEFGPADASEDEGISATHLVRALEANAELPTATDDSTTLPDRLRQVSAATLLSRLKAIQVGPTLMGISVVDQVADGVSLPSERVFPQLGSAIGQNGVPLILGTNRDEFRIMSMADEELTGSFWFLAFWPKNDDHYQANGEYPSRMFRALGVVEPAELLVHAGNGPVYTYRFDWDEQGRKLFTDVSSMIGASHALEIAFVTGGFDDLVNDPLGMSFNDDNRPGREQLSSAMMSYWAEFAYSGSPGRGRKGDLPEWRALQPGRNAPSSIVFDTARGGGIRMTDERETPLEVMQAIASDQRLDTPQIRCKVAESTMVLVKIFRVDEAWYEEMVEDYCVDR
jgi:para-nitrobenzyl esterase